MFVCAWQPSLGYFYCRPLTYQPLVLRQDLRDFEFSRYGPVTISKIKIA